jgi:hypothetical protein
VRRGRHYMLHIAQSKYIVLCSGSEDFFISSYSEFKECLQFTTSPNFEDVVAKHQPGSVKEISG